MVVPTVRLFHQRIFVCPEIIIVVDLQIESVRDIDLLVFDVPTPREHLHVCPLTVATATQYAVYLLNRDSYIDARLNYGSEYEDVRRL